MVTGSNAIANRTEPPTAAGLAHSSVVSEPFFYRSRNHLPTHLLSPDHLLPSLLDYHCLLSLSPSHPSAFTRRWHCFDYYDRPASAATSPTAITGPSLLFLVYSLAHLPPLGCLPLLGHQIPP